MTRETKALRTEIGSRVRKLRQERRWSQTRLAALLGISQNYLSLLERGLGSFTAEQLLTILKHFNVPIDDFSPKKTPAEVEGQIQNALARQGATHLLESELIPSERLKQAIDAIREALVSAESARHITAVAPILVNHAGQINLTKLRNELAELGLENRLGWVIDNTLAALKLESSQVLPREWRLRYRRAGIVIGLFFRPWEAFSRPAGDPLQPPAYDVLDPEITSEETLKQVEEELAPIAKHWRIATTIEVDDFVKALRSARGAD
ncbi:MAG: helix-turn-helix transcriptional regulator [Elusimicrobia bacterium]|nr:helix-turn-helix transcriptional regulator [Elusimicrobiota bacterium]